MTQTPTTILHKIDSIVLLVDYISGTEEGRALAKAYVTKEKTTNPKAKLLEESLIMSVPVLVRSCPPLQSGAPPPSPLLVFAVQSLLSLDKRWGMTFVSYKTFFLVLKSAVEIVVRGAGPGWEAELGEGLVGIGSEVAERIVQYISQGLDMLATTGENNQSIRVIQVRS